MSPPTLEILNFISEVNADSDLDFEIANFVTENQHLIHFEELFDALPEGFYNSWSSIVLRNIQLINRKFILSFSRQILSEN